jgi:hypothetical protein
MPPKFKFSREEIITRGFDIVRRRGWRGLSTRALAASLGASARPIYSFFKSIEELEEEIVKKAVRLLFSYMTRSWTGDPWEDHGIGYVMFAQDEKHLFRGCNDQRHIEYYKKYGDVIWETLTASLVDYPHFRGLSEDQIYQIQLTRWLYAHGLAFQVSAPPPGLWNEEKIILMMQQGSTAIREGLINNFFPKNGRTR